MTNPTNPMQALSVIPLPMSKDLYRPPQFDENGNIIPRPDNVSNTDFVRHAEGLSGDAQAIMMSEMMRLQNLQNDAKE